MPESFKFERPNLKSQRGQVGQRRMEGLTATKSYSQVARMAGGNYIVSNVYRHLSNILAR
jgi:hypothetical protein